MNFTRTQVFGHNGVQRAVLLDPNKTYEVTKEAGQMRLQGCTSPVGHDSRTEGPWVAIVSDRIAGFYAVRADVDGFESGRAVLSVKAA